MIGVLAWAGVTRRWEPILLAALAVAVTDPLCARLIKPSFDRDRPCRVEAIHTSAPCGAGASMPSNHAANLASIAMATSSWPLGVVAVLGGVSRVVQGQHYPSDVLVGWLVGAGVGAGVRGVLAKWTERRRPWT